MFKKLLIANRGEIALRIIRTARELGIPTVAVYSEADRASLHVRFADEAVCIGPGPAAKSYLDQSQVLAAAEITDADAIHPGYGFLAENAAFAAAVRASGRTFVGPTPDHLRMFGDKVQAKQAARAAGLPLVGGSDGEVATAEAAAEVSAAIGFPVLLKAAGGGGGKGMRAVERLEDLPSAFDMCRAEAGKAFGASAIFVEKYLKAPRHVEVQVAGDGRGGALWIGTRDCSLQRRHQKIVEEAPAPNLPEGLEAKILAAAANLMASVGYCTLATVECLVEGSDFYFLEVNPRIQVEHPVTEETTGIDLVALQLRLAAGLGFGMEQSDVRTRGHAFEVRVNAENPWTFAPSPGRITGYHEPGGFGVRIDAAAYEQAQIPPYYDSLVAKLIVRGDTREQALRRTLRALDEFVVEGIHTTLPMQRELLRTTAVRDVSFYTRFVDAWLSDPANRPS